MNNKHHVFFALSLSLLILPACSYLPFWDRADLYKTMDARRSLELAHYQSIFKDTEPLSVAFIGLSSMWVGVDAKQIERHLAAKGLKNPNVIMLGANHPGEDLVYVMTKDLLENRSVDMIVLSNPNRAQDHPHPMFHRLASAKELSNVWWELDLDGKLKSVALAVLGTPYQIYSQIKPAYEPRNKRNLLQNNGSWIRKLGWSKSRFELFEPLVYEEPNSNTDGLDVAIDDYSKIEFENVFTDYQSVFFRKTVELANSHGTKVSVLATPTWFDRNSDKLKIRIDQSYLRDLDLSVIGVIPTQMFGSMSDEQIEKLYYDRNHLNFNGAKLHSAKLTKVIDRLMNDL